MNERPFRLEVHLAAPAILNGPTTLDSLLAGALFRMDGDLEKAHREIPLANTAGVWHGSAAFTEGFFALRGVTITGGWRMHQYGHDFIADGVKFGRGGKVKKLSAGSGPMRNVMNDYFVTGCRRLIWFGCGDPSAVMDLMGMLPGVGKRAGSGYGEIAHMSVSELPVDRSLVTVGGYPARPIPRAVWQTLAGAKPNVSFAAGRFTPPYWTGEEVECAQPEPLERRIARPEPGARVA